MFLLIGAMLKDYNSLYECLNTSHVLINQKGGGKEDGYKQV